MKLSYLDLYTTDPAYNLACEQYVFDVLPRDRSYFMLWQNDNAVIVGKYQNTLAEINEDFVRSSGVRVVRRLSGGGAVYHDLGNLNFTFITDADELNAMNFKVFCEPVIRTLAKFGVQAEVNGRNDMTIDGKKFSGNAQYRRQGRVMHHGTIMFCSDLGKVSQALRVDERKFQSKATKSVRSRVTNVADYLPQPVELETFRAALLADIAESVGGTAYPLTEADRAAIEALRSERYASWEWNYGSSPDCTIRRSERVEGCGTVTVSLSVSHGTIAEMHFEGDFFSLLEPDELAARFIGRRADAESYAEVLQDVDAASYFVGLDNAALLKLLCS